MPRTRPHLVSAFRLFFAAATSLGLLLTLGAPAARAATWYVHPGGGGNATTIRAILAVAVFPLGGARVVVV